MPWSPWPTPSDEDWWEPPEPVAPDLTVDLTENPVVYELLGPDGTVIRQWLEREPIGYRIRPPTP